MCQTVWLTKRFCLRNIRELKEKTTPNRGPTGTIRREERRDVRSQEVKGLVAKPEMKVSSPFFIPASKDGRIAARVKEEDRRLGEVMGWKYRVIEKSGRLSTRQTDV